MIKLSLVGVLLSVSFVVVASAIGLLNVALGYASLEWVSMGMSYAGLVGVIASSLATVVGLGMMAWRKS